MRIFFARRFDLPIVSIDNQQIIHKCKHDEASPKASGADYRATRAFVKAKLPGCDHYLITSFFTPADPRQIRAIASPSCRPSCGSEILALTPTKGDHVLVYQTSTSDKALLAELNRLPEAQFRRVRASARRGAGQLRHPQFLGAGLRRAISLRRARS